MLEKIMKRKKSLMLLIPAAFILLTMTVTSCSWVPRLKVNVDGPVKEAWSAIYKNSSMSASVNQANAIATDNFGNVFVSGYDDGNITTIKYNNQGKRAWLSTYVTENNNDDIYAMAFDDSGNILVCGSYIIKYDTDGKQIWAEPFEDAPGNQGAATTLVLDKEGNIIAGGDIYTGNVESYAVIKYDSNGNRIWAVQDYPQIWNYGHYLINKGAAGLWNDVKIDQSGNIYVAGTIGIIKYDETGKKLWTGNNGGWQIALDTTGNIYVTGSKGTTKYSSSGDILWTKQDKGSAIVLDSAGNPIIASSTIIKYDVDGNELWQQPDGGAFIVQDNNGKIYVACSYYIVKYDVNGNQQWKATIAQPDGSGFKPYAFTLDNNKGVYIAGELGTTVIAGDWGGHASCTIKFVQK